MTYVASIHMSTYNRTWTQGGTAGYYSMFSANQENGYVYFVGATTTGGPLNRLINVTHPFTSINVIAPTNDMISLYKAKVKSTSEFANAFAAFSSFPSVITSSGNFVLPNNALPLVNLIVQGGGGSGGGGHHGGGGGGGGSAIKLTAYQAVGTTSITIGSGGGHGRWDSGVGNSGSSTYFGNVYALGGGAGAGHNNTGASGGNGGGGGGHNTGYGGAGITQTASTGLGFSGSPEYFGGNSGSGTNGSNGGQQRGGGGGGAGGTGSAGGNGTGGNGGPAHQSDLPGTNTAFGYGGWGTAHHDGGHGSNGSHSGPAYGHGGVGAGHNRNFGHGAEYATGGGNGVVVVRYYIP
jgi:hypothetical protein